MLEGGLFWLIVRVIFNGFNINIPFLLSWKLYVVFVQLACHRWSTNLLDVDLIKESDLDGCQRWKFFFVVPGWFMPYFHPLPFLNKEEYGEGEISQVVVFVYLLSLHFSSTNSQQTYRGELVV